MTGADRAVEALLAAMTLEEKVAQLGSVRIGDLLEDGSFSRALAAETIPDGVGRVTRVGRESGLSPAALAAVIDDVQAYLRTETRLGIPALVREEGLCGYAGRGGTVFPQAIGLASSWDPALLERVAAATADQLRAVGCGVTLSPVADLGVDPRWGRIEETYGEDPCLAARLTVATVEGLQTDAHDSSRVLATLKHFAGHGRPAGGRNRARATVSTRRLRESDFRPFRAGIEHGDVASVMAAYNAVDGVPCHASPALLTGILREEWGFAGAVVSDGRGIEQLCTTHRVAPDRQTAGVQALRAGVDVELPETECFGERLTAAVRDGQVSEAAVDRAVRRHLRLKARAGLLADGESEATRPSIADAFDADRTRSLAREAARRSLVLLETDGRLPLSSDDELAVVGPNADAGRALLGNYAYANAENEAAGDVVTPLAALRERAEAGAVPFARGCAVAPGNDRETPADGDGDAAAVDRPATDIAAAADLAADADAVVACVGSRSGIDVERDATGTAGEGLDRATLELPGRQAELLSAVAATGTPVVAVLVGGRPLSLAGVVDDLAAVVAAWLPGQAGGHAIADVLYGTDPGGRLPVSMPRAAGQMPAHYRQPPQSANGEYVGTDGGPLYPFGHGESYASFAYGELSVAAETVPADGSVTASVTVANEAARPGEEVVQLYLRDREASVVRPVRELAGFRRLSLDAGEAATVRFTVAADQAAVVTPDGDHVVEPGAVDVLAGRSAADVRASGAFEIEGESGGKGGSDADGDDGKRVLSGPPTFYSDATVERSG